MLVFSGQLLDQHHYNEAIDNYCDLSRSRIQEMVYQQIKENNQLIYCDDIAFILTNAPDQDKAVRQLLDGFRPLTGFDASETRQYVSQMLRDALL